jgi:antitoxin HicB
MRNMEFAYPFTVRKTGGEYIVEFPDVPEAVTGAQTREEAAAMARDALLAALGGYVDDRRDIPQPSARKGKQLVAYLDPLEAAKLALYIAMQEKGLSNVGLASRLHMDEKAVRRMLDLDQKTKIDTIHDALRQIFDYRLVTAMHRAGQFDAATGHAAA